MDTQLKQELEQKLKQAKQEIKSNLGEFANEDETIEGNYWARFPEYGRGESEEAQEYSEYDERLSLEHKLEIDLKKIDAALDKMESGEYGLCEECGDQISPDRLRVYPEAKLCKQCVGRKD